VPSGLLAMYQQGTTSQAKRPDPRIKTVIAFAPWGMNYKVWNEQGLADIDVPMLFVAGSVDDVSGYESGVRALWQNAKNTERALLTYENANHSAGAPMPAPEESFYFSEELGFNVSEHYQDAVWESARMNNIAQHFATAWLEKYLKKNAEMQEYLNLVPASNNGIWAKDQSGAEKPEHTHWKGFKNRTAKGLKFEWLKAQD
jgi:predicted dienelactone hydrolase